MVVVLELPEIFLNDISCGIRVLLENPFNAPKRFCKRLTFLLFKLFELQHMTAYQLHNDTSNPKFATYLHFTFISFVISATLCTAVAY